MIALCRAFEEHAASWQRSGAGVQLTSELSMVVKNQPPQGLARALYTAWHDDGGNGACVRYVSFASVSLVAWCAMMSTGVRYLVSQKLVAWRLS